METVISLSSQEAPSTQVLPRGGQSMRRLTRFSLPHQQTYVASVIAVLAGTAIICLCLADWALKANFKYALLVTGQVAGVFCVVSGALGRVLCKRRERPLVTALLVIAVIGVVASIVLFGFTVMEIALIKMDGKTRINTPSGLVINVVLAAVSAAGALCAVFLASLCTRMVSSCCNGEPFSCCGYICIPKDTMAYERVQFIRYGSGAGRNLTITMAPDEFVVPYRQCCISQFPPSYDEIVQTPGTSTQTGGPTSPSSPGNNNGALPASSPPSYRSLDHLTEEEGGGDEGEDGMARGDIERAEGGEAGSSLDGAGESSLSPDTPACRLRDSTSSLPRHSRSGARPSVRSFTFSLRSLAHPFTFSQRSLRAISSQRPLARTRLDSQHDGDFSEEVRAMISKDGATSSLESTV